MGDRTDKLDRAFRKATSAEFTKEATELGDRRRAGEDVKKQSEEVIQRVEELFAHGGAYYNYKMGFKQSLIDSGVSEKDAVKAIKREIKRAGSSQVTETKRALAEGSKIKGARVRYEDDHLHTMRLIMGAKISKLKFITPAYAKEGKPTEKGQRLLDIIKASKMVVPKRGAELTVQDVARHAAAVRKTVAGLKTSIREHRETGKSYIQRGVDIMKADKSVLKDVGDYSQLGQIKSAVDGGQHYAAKLLGKSRTKAKGGQKKPKKR